MKSAAQLTAENKRLQQSVKEQALELKQKNRELEIEVALERVRSRSLAMHKSDELNKIVSVLYHEMEAFGFAKWACTLQLFDQKSQNIELWSGDYLNEDFQRPYYWYGRENKWINELWLAWESKIPTLSFHLKGKEKTDFDEYLFTKTDYKDFPQEVKTHTKSIDEVYFNLAYFKFGFLVATDMEAIPAENFELLVRFAKVFEQSYTRFLDLQKAEAQAREAQIEVALERVRARAMAMHSSDELISVAIVLREQMQLLGQTELIGAVVELYETHPNYIESWHAFRPAGNQDAPIETGVVLFEKNSCAVLREMIESYQGPLKEYTLEASGEKIIEWYKVLKEVVPELKNSKVPEQEFYHCADFSGGTLLLASLNEPSNEAKELLMRSSKVFDLAYTRFLDLQKAEAQAREAKIEAALERVRSRAMAMHQTNELNEVSMVLYKELKNLDFQFVSCGFEIVLEEEQVLKVWNHDFNQGQLSHFQMPLKGDKTLKERLKAWKSRKAIFLQELDGIALNEHLRIGAPETVKNEKDLISLFNFPDPAYFCLANFSKGGLHVIGKSQVQIDHQKILIRFAKVFDQAYTRFLDLQKAEEQARDAEIELALERVRSRTMAMHQSEELSEVAALLFDQLKILGAQLWTAGFAICKKDEVLVEKWMSSPIPGQMFNHLFIPYNADHGEQRMYDTWKNQQALHSYAQGGKELKDIYDHLMEIPSFKANFQKVIDFGRPLPVWQKNHVAAYKYGYLLIITEEEFEEEYIFPRFAKVFEQTYTRFLDLEKAEAQAREAEIELALERVRAKSMEMHHSDDLKEVVAVLYEQINRLKIAAWGSGIIIFNEPKDYQELWLSTDANDTHPRSYKIHGQENRLIKELWRIWKKRLENQHIDLVGDIKEDYDNYAFTKTELKNLPIKTINAIRSMPDSYVSLAWMKCGLLALYDDTSSLSEASFVVLRRFAKVFDQAYTRFLDLQRAEAQAKESQIEAALERVRSRTMAMQKSEELTDVAALLFNQVSEMGIKVWTAGFNVWSKDNNYYTDYITSPKGGFIKPYTVDTQQDPVLKEVSDARKSGMDYFLQYAEGEPLRQMYLTLTRFGDEKQYEIILRDGFQFPSHQYHHFIFGQEVSLMFVSFEAVPEARDIFQRFGKVFEQTYTRFLDLQKAEAQAREAQIEAALERVRSTAMAMHSSEDLHRVAEELRKQIGQLDYKDLETCAIHLYDESPDYLVSWAASLSPNSESEILQSQNRFPKKGVSVLEELIARYNGPEEDYVVVNEGEKMTGFLEMLKEIAPETHQLIKNTYKDFAPEDYRSYWTVSDFKGGSLLMTTFQRPDAETHQLLRRFADVFGLAYRRFVDLKNAENQARESQIQLALERVRARTMAMHKSEELIELNAVILQQVRDLGVEIFAAGIHITDPNKPISETWIGDPVDGQMPRTLIDHSEDQLLVKMYEGWKSGKKLIIELMEGDELKNHFQNMAKMIPQQKIFEELVPPDRIYFHLAYFSYGFFVFATVEPCSENHDIFTRFAKVFEQTYTRFLDLKKAEAQAREAEIEVALERVRAKMMAMHKSEELREVIGTIFNQLQLLGFDAPGSALIIFDKDLAAEHWMTGFSKSEFPESYKIPYVDHPYFTDLLKEWKNDTTFREFYFEGKLKIQYAEWCLENSDFKRMPSEFKKEMLDPARMVISDAFNKYGMLEIIGSESLTQEKISILNRFSKVFEQTYTRFLDLQKVEAQARESQIEASLEKIRSRSLAMHSSEELQEVINLVFERIQDLSIPIDSAAINILEKEDPKHYKVWIQNTTRAYSTCIKVPFYEENIMGKEVASVIRGHKKSLNKKFSKKVKNNWLRYMFKHSDFGRMPVELQQYSLNKPALMVGMSSKSHAAIIIYRYEGSIFTEAEMDVLDRFSAIFDQAYTRFLDLKKAEAQARESQIEAALERVRSSAMAMQKSSHLKEVVRVMIENLNALDVETRLCEILLFGNNFDSWKSWIYVGSGKNLLDFEFSGPYFNHPFNEHHKNAFQKGLKYTSYVLEGEDKKSFDKLFDKHMTGSNLNQLKELVFPIKRTVFSLAFLSQGAVLVGSDQPLSKEGSSILERFAKVVDFTYTRVEDLQKAEKRTLEAIKQSSLDRVRAEIASMRNTEDLQRITPLIWRELLTLGVPFFRCGLMIVDEKEEKVRFYLSTPDGKPLAALNLDFDSNNISTNGVKYWRKQEPYVDHWNQEEFLAFSKTLLAEHQIQNVKTYQGGEAPPESLTLQFIPFPQGMLYVGSKEDLSPAQIELVQNLADAFSVAYARYEDFKQLEDAKSQIEQTLSELKSTQAQLIQSEKMASLGELTAGIAHEIQNPLNFVNNFSEVSGELVEEMNEELEKGDIEEAKFIAQDLRDNLIKINHHGKRADAIVKGMLEHSRINKGEKAPTDLNALADEFVRLSYHGLRAKDKSFNADFKLELDPQLPKVNLVASDIGRVILNLVNNAFYAVHEKAKSATHDYSPEVIVRSKKTEKGIELFVQDNGPGIPDSIKEKIFQPFFTTKPTGSGTGLGLSLSYDIVKAHGGELKVSSKNGGETIFTLVIPAT
ncbi:sensor histidine kinase [Algoriphagus namhaensis]|uniref:histidine kinase n=1 Tax=Algoriphagus namhaensis TaxID=915353 RepID=A0ABV8ASD7_9BACT